MTVVVEENRARTRGVESILLPNTFIVFGTWWAAIVGNCPSYGVTRGNEVSLECA